MINAEWFVQNFDTVKDTVAAVCSDETKEDLIDMRVALEEALDIAFDIMREPLAVHGVQLRRSRSVIDPEKRREIIGRLEKLADIVPYAPQN